MHRFFVAPDRLTETAVTFPAALAHQVRTVLRLPPGDEVVVLDNTGQEYTVTLVDVTREQVTGQITGKRPSPGEPAVQLTLYAALLKRDNFEWVLQKGTEIGITRFIPLLTRRTVVTAVSPAKQERWQRILIEAAEQSRRGRVPTLAPPLPLTTALSTLTTDLALIPWEEMTGYDLRAALSGQHPRSVALFIGPEGGFDPAEVAQATAQGVIPVTLGPRILRAETAVLVASALIIHELDICSSHAR